MESSFWSKRRLFLLLMVLLLSFSSVLAARGLFAQVNRQCRSGQPICMRKVRVDIPPRILVSLDSVSEYQMEEIIGAERPVNRHAFSRFEERVQPRELARSRFIKQFW